ncbi:MAG: lamin tail domain-containing protein [Verrucomicrobiales bacterium]|nr:lamin tail domain-containing protein [Verrucomicrobiales bacterium]
MAQTRLNLGRLSSGALAATVVSLCTAQTIFVPTGADWRFLKGTREASTPVDAWRRAGFVDAGWSSAPAPFHYGDGVSEGTELSDMRGSYTCVFTRRTFEVADVAALDSVLLGVDYDDGFVAWINGVEVARAGVNGEPAYNAAASSSHEGGSLVTFTISLPPSAFLAEGVNVLAMQGFNRSLSGSSDFRLDATLMATGNDGAAPVITSRTPLPGTLAALTEIRVVFSEKVVGVDAADLRLNDRGADAVVAGAGGGDYTFRFSQPPPGLIQVAWSEGGGITDVQGNPFDTEAAAASWSYELADTVGPRVLDQTPYAAARIGRLTQVELWFDEPVGGVDAGDLRANDQPATSLSGNGAGPYVFGFEPPAAGTVNFSWTHDHGITDRAPIPNAFAGANWSVVLDPALPAADVVISEICAAGYAGFLDEDGEPQDWIEIWNRGAVAVNLLGWSLTDDPAVPGRWVFPATQLVPGGQLVVFASGKDRRASGGGNRLHTNFKLNPFGEYLGLFSAESPRRVASELAPRFPEQRYGYSYGRTPQDTWTYFTNPTPGVANSPGALTAIAPPPHFTVGRGLFDEPFRLLLTTPLEGATIRFTTDGSEPTAANGTVYSNALRIERSTTLRAATFKSGYLPSRTETASYLFLDDVINQPANPAGFPSNWGSNGGFPGGLVPADYEMDSDPLRVNPSSAASPVDPEKLERLRAGLRDLPVVSLVMDRNDMFGPAGLYPRASDSNKAPNEKPVSVEMILPDGSTAFVIDGGLDLHGNASRNPQKNPKHGFKLTFKKEYGPATLDYPLFPDSPARRFDDLLLRPDFNSSWRHWSDSAGNGSGAFQRSRGTRTRYAWSQETFRDMGHVSPHTLFFHLFINGLYWGAYDFGEQPTRTFAEAYYGGEGITYDVYDQGGLREGSAAAYNAMTRLGNLADNSAYEAMKQYLDLPEFMDYMLLHFYVGHQDWGNNKNWYAVRPDVAGPSGTFKYLPWDQECILLEENVNRVPNGGGSTDVPSALHTKLDDNAQYRMDFADRVFRHLLAPGGALTGEANIARWQRWEALLDRAIVAESCRWGDYRRDVHRYADGTFQLYTREDHWLPENSRMVNSYFVNRGGVVLGQLRAAGLYPDIEPPDFNRPGGRVPPGFTMALRAAAGAIYYTTDGSDPRVYGSGAVAAQARVYTGPVALDRSVLIRTRLLRGATWSALKEAAFTVGEPGLPLRISEIMYNPAGGEALEFVEVINAGSLPLDLSRFRFAGIDYIFPDSTTLMGGATLVIASGDNPAAFRQRYPGVVVSGWFAGRLDNGGERLAILDRDGNTVTAVHYDDEAGWPSGADGGGFSIESRDLQADPNAPAGWHASSAMGGTPGLPPNPPSPSEVVINELMADNISAVANGNGHPDWVELHNRGDLGVDLAGWSLTDDSDPRRFVFPAGTVLAPHGYLLVWCDDEAGSPGLHAGFALGRRGDTVLLHDPAGNRADAVSFGLQVPDLSLGRAGDGWQLTIPTPGAANVAVTLASPDRVALNEWLANPGPGEADWIELFNRATDAPASLDGLWLGVNAGLARIPSLSFLPPGGHARFFADENAGVEHLEIKLPASGARLSLLDATGFALESVDYGPQSTDVSEGRLPDGEDAVTPFAGSVSPGAPNHIVPASGPVLNEVLARNRHSGVSPWGDTPDWVELHNPTGEPVDLAGWTLARGTGGTDRWTFPVGATLPAGGFLQIWCDAAEPASVRVEPAWNTGFSLDGESDDIGLRDARGQLIDAVGFGFQVTDLSIGRTSGGWQLLERPTPAAPNAAPAVSGPSSALRINEWMAEPLTGDDWFELYNQDLRPVDLAGLFLTDDPSVAGRTKMQVAPLSYVGGREWVRWRADDKPGEGRDHARFQLDGRGETLRLYARDQTLIDGVEFGGQIAGVSEGRLPDGAAATVAFPQTSTPGDANFLPLDEVVINEVLAHTDLPLEDAIELHNPGGLPVDLGGWFLSDDPGDPKRYRIPEGTMLAPGGYRVFYQAAFGSSGGEDDVPPRFNLNSARGEQVLLSEANAAGALTGRRRVIGFGATANGVSLGRFPTSTGVDFVALTARTFGADAPATVAEFRTGSGLPNAAALVGPVVVSEILYALPESSGNGGLVAGGEFIELYNRTGAAVALFDAAFPEHGWRLAGAVDFEFPPGTVLEPGARLVVVPFDPVVDLLARQAFANAYGDAGTILGPYAGRLDRAGETLELRRPDTPQSAPSPGAGFVPYILVEKVAYSPAAPWPVLPEDLPASLQRIDATAYANDPVNWRSGAPNPGGTATEGDRDGDALPDAWEEENGTDPDRPDAHEDPDGDGADNEHEYQAGTDPRSPTSVLEMATVGVEMDRVVFEFTAMAGRTYSLVYQDALGAGGWRKLADVEASGGDRIVTLTDSAPPATGRFYQIVSPAQP